MRGRNALARTPYVFDRKGEPSHAVSERPERKSGRPAAGIAQQGRDRPAGAAGARRREHRPHGDPSGQARKHRGHPHVHGSGCCRPAGTSRSQSISLRSTRPRTRSRRPAPSWPRSRAAISRHRRRPISPRWSTSTCWRRRAPPSRSAWPGWRTVRRRRTMASNGRKCRHQTRTVPSPRAPGVPGSRLVLRRGRGHSECVAMINSIQTVGGPGPSLPAKRILRQTSDEAARHHQRRRRSPP